MQLDLTPELAKLTTYTARVALTIRFSRRCEDGTTDTQATKDTEWLSECLCRLGRLGRAIESGNPLQILRACETLSSQYDTFPVEAQAAFERHGDVVDIRVARSIFDAIRAKANRAFRASHAPAALAREGRLAALVSVPQILDPELDITPNTAARLAFVLRERMAHGEYQEPSYVQSPLDTEYLTPPGAWASAGSLPQADIELREAIVDMQLSRERFREYGAAALFKRSREMRVAWTVARRHRRRVNDLVRGSAEHAAALRRILGTLAPGIGVHTVLEGFIR